MFLLTNPSNFSILSLDEDSSFSTTHRNEWCIFQQVESQPRPMYDHQSFIRFKFLFPQLSPAAENPAVGRRILLVLALFPYPLLLLLPIHQSLTLQGLRVRMRIG